MHIAFIFILRMAFVFTADKVSVKRVSRLDGGDRDRIL
jgi:hypothetical protein